MADLEEQKAKLHQAKAEYEKIMSSDVNMSQSPVCASRH
jgi:hypothetical protein